MSNPQEKGLSAQRISMNHRRKRDLLPRQYQSILESKDYLLKDVNEPGNKGSVYQKLLTSQPLQIRKIIYQS